MAVFGLVRTLVLTTAAAALGVSHLASAATFDGVGNHTLTSSNLGITANGLNSGWDCTSSVLELNVPAGGASATVTGAAFSGCSGTDGFAIVPAEVTATNFPWGITRTGPGAFTIDRIHVIFDHTSIGLSVTLEGSLVGGTINCSTHTVTYANAGNLTVTATGGGHSATVVNGDFREDPGTLCVT